MGCTESTLTPTVSASSQMVILILRDQYLYMVNCCIILTCFGPTWTWFTLHRSAANFEAIVPLLNLCSAHGLLPENLLNLPNDFHFCYLQAFENIWCNTAAQVILQFCGRLKSDRYPLHKLNHRLTANQSCSLLAEKNLCPSLNWEQAVMGARIFITSWFLGISLL